MRSCGGDEPGPKRVIDNMKKFDNDGNHHREHQSMNDSAALVSLDQITAHDNNILTGILAQQYLDVSHQKDDACMTEEKSMVEEKLMIEEKPMI